MLALLQRVSHAEVQVKQREIASIQQGILVFIGVEPNDDTSTCERICRRLLGYRVFSDTEGKMNLSVKDIEGSVLLVPQFTLAADTKSGMRPGFSTAAIPEHGEAIFNQLATMMQNEYPAVVTGQFAADMAVTLCNQGPVTFLLR